MALEDELKAKTLALISGQMANWVVEIQRSIADQQATFVRMLDELQESVARYDERINEGEIGNAISDVVAANPVAPAGGGAVATLRASLAQVEKGASLSEVLTYLVNEASSYSDRAAMFIVKGANAIGWYARGFQTPDTVKTINIPLNADTIFRNVSSGRKAMRGHISQTPGTGQALARLGAGAQGLIAVPLVLKDKIAAILYCDSQVEEIPGDRADSIEILVSYAGKVIDLLSAAPRPAGSTTTGATTSDRAAAIRSDSEEVRARAGVPPARPPAPAPPPPPPAEEGASTVMFNASTFAKMKEQVVPAARPAPPPAARPAPPAAPGGKVLSPEEQKSHEEAKRFARLVVSEIKLYNESKVSEGRRQKDLYERLKEDIERGRQMYTDRVAAPVRDATNYFYDELVRILAGGDASALGPM
jgi:hypothetical protein